MPKKGTSEKKGQEKQTCPVCGGDLVDGATFCSPACEIAFLKRSLAEKDERIANLATRGSKGPVKCYGRIEFGTCVLELYTKASFDAKRRAQELRKSKFDCWAHVLDRMPILNGDGTTVDTKMTALICAIRVEGDRRVSPPEPTMVEGLWRATDHG
jgi:hypothetical protein